MVAKKKALVLLGFLIVSALVVRSIRVYHYIDIRKDKDWYKIAEWCKRFTNKTDKFITPPNTSSFRILSLRTTINERCSALAWVDPYLYKENDKLAEQVEKAYFRNFIDLDYLFALADGWDVNYIIIKGSYNSIINPIYRSGKYSIFKVSRR